MTKLMLVVLGLSGLLGAGCASEKHAGPQGAPAVLASVDIRDRTPTQIAETAAEVFRAHDYQIVQQNKRGLICEKPGSTLSRFAYGDWTTKNSVWQRVTLFIVPVGETAFRLDCDAQLITNKGDPTEEPAKYAHVRRAPLQQMLEEIAAHLRQPPEALSPP